VTGPLQPNAALHLQHPQPTHSDNHHHHNHRRRRHHHSPTTAPNNAHGPAQVPAQLSAHAAEFGAQLGAGQVPARAHPHPGPPRRPHRPGDVHQEDPDREESAVAVAGAVLEEGDGPVAPRQRQPVCAHRALSGDGPRTNHHPSRTATTRVMVFSTQKK